MNTETRDVFERAAAHSIAFREAIPDRKVPQSADIGEMVRRFRKPLSDKGSPAINVIDDLAAKAADGLNGMCAPSFYGYVLGGSHPVGVAADMMVSAWGQNAASALETPAIAALERTVCDWVIDLLGLPENSGAGLVTGASVANMVGIMAARNGLLSRQDWDVEARGLFGAPEVPVLIGEDAHSAVHAALRYAGFGSERVTYVATDAEGRMDLAAFMVALDACQAPPLVVLQAGQINSGAFDTFEQLVPAVHAQGGWVHVDGAFGLWLAAVPELADRLAGVQQADSWAVDLHKWLNAPFDAGMIVCKDRAPLVRSMSARGSYLPDLQEQWEPSDSTPELSRRARGVPSYAILRHLGKSGVREMVIRHCNFARQVSDRLKRIDGITVLNTVASNQVALAFGEGKEGDVQTQNVLREVQRRGFTYPSHGTWLGRQIVRVSIINYATTQDDVDLLCEEISGAWKKIMNV